MDDQEIKVLIELLKIIGYLVLVIGLLIDGCFAYILYRGFKELDKEEELNGNYSGRTSKEKCKNRK